jgi:hypothetical protein
MVERQQKNLTLAGFLRAVATGVFGTVLLVLFLENFMATEPLANLIPVIVIFNAAVSGFSLTRSTERVSGDRLAAIVAGGLCAGISLGLFSVLGTEATSEAFFGPLLILLACVGGLLFGLAGSWLAARQVALQYPGGPDPSTPRGESPVPEQQTKT